MDLSERVAEVEQQLAAQKAVVAEALARLRGLESELEALRSAPEDGDLLAAPRTEAIVTILRRARGSMSPTDILAGLEDAGRSDELRAVTATLDHLLKKGTVQRPSRGRYLAT